MTEPLKINQIHIPSLKSRTTVPVRSVQPVRILDDSLAAKLKPMVASRPAVVVCVGTDLLSGDCLGPLVGQFLVEAELNAFVYGTLLSPVNALNINDVNDFINWQHRHQTIIAVDSAVGDNKGRITIGKEPLKPGSADGKNLRPIGDISITAVTSTHLPHQKGFSLVPLGFVYRLARTIADAILDVLKTCTHG